MSKSIDKFKITTYDIEVLQKLEARKSVLNFSDNELKLTAQWADRFGEEIKEKSPFYRAVNGDWRENDGSEVSVISVENRNADFKRVRDDIKSQVIPRGEVINADTGWAVQISRKGLEDTVKYGFKHKDNAVYNILYNTNEIIQNSILLDSTVSTRNKPNKAYNTAFMHSLYSVCRIDSKNYLVKSTVEEFFDGKNGTLRRVYNIQDIKTEPLRRIEFTGNRLARSVLSGSSISVSDLFKIVKTCDKDFYFNKRKNSKFYETENTLTLDNLSKVKNPSRPEPIVLKSEKPAEKLKEITAKLENGIKELFNSERFKEYLTVMSKFHKYSGNNTLLIAMQKPDATLVAGFSAWKNKFSRSVKKGEKGIKILAPSPRKYKMEIEKIDPATCKPVIGKDGKPVIETTEVTVTSYRVVSVFDVSQTEGKELPSIADNLTADVAGYDDFFTALKEASPVPIGFEKMRGGVHGYFSPGEERIAIAENMGQLQTLKTAVHEIAHSKLHNFDPLDKTQNKPDYSTCEVQAESVAYTVCSHYGLDTSEYSFGYVASWSQGRELDELKSSLETIHKASAEIISDVDKSLARLQKERAEKAKTESDADKLRHRDTDADGLSDYIDSEYNKVQDRYTHLTDGEFERLQSAKPELASYEHCRPSQKGGYILKCPQSELNEVKALIKELTKPIKPILK